MTDLSLVDYDGKPPRDHAVGSEVSILYSPRDSFNAIVVLDLDDEIEIPAVMKLEAMK